MKTARLTAALILVVSILALASCYWFSNFGKGQISFEFSAVASRGLDDLYGRVYLLSDGKRFALSGSAEYLQVPLSDIESTTVVVDGIPVGPKYTALVSVVRERSGEWFSTEGWGESFEPFEVIPNDIISIPLSFQNPNFYAVEPLMGKNIKAFESDGTDIYVAEAGIIHVSTLDPSWTWTWNPDSWSNYPISSQVINSLTMGVDMSQVPNIFSQLWVNTNKGIYPFTGETLASPLTVALGTESILDSFLYSKWSWPNRLYFQRGEGIGGAYITDIIANDPSQWDWINLDADKVLDMTPGVAGGAAFATVGGAFRVSEELLLDPTPNLSEHQSNIACPSPIRSLRIFDSDAEEQLHIGSEDGAWENEAWDSPDKGLVQESYTKGYPIRRIVFEEDYSSWRAYLSDAYIFVVDDADNLVAKYPFVSGFPGKVNSIEWAYDGGSYAFLFVATNEGLVYASFNVGGV